LVLTKTQPVAQDWAVHDRVTITGQIFDTAGGWNMSPNDRNQVVFDNKKGFEAVEASIGWRGTNDKIQGGFQFVVLANGTEVYRSPWLHQSDPALAISVPIKGKRGVTLVTEADAELERNRDSVALWANPKFTRNASLPAKPGPPDPRRPDPPPVGTKVLRLEGEKIDELAKGLSKTISKVDEFAKNKPKIAIARFLLIPTEELSPSNAENVREDLTTALIETDTFAIVERGQLDKALEELRINQKDTFDSSKAQALGKLVGARLVLIGSISDREGKSAVINARFIDTQTGEVRGGGRIEISQEASDH
jgi:TolB-like protein